MQPGQTPLNPLDPWLPLYAAGIAATVSLIVALINAWSARRLDTARSYRDASLGACPSNRLVVGHQFEIGPR